MEYDIAALSNGEWVRPTPPRHWVKGRRGFHNMASPATAYPARTTADELPARCGRLWLASAACAPVSSIRWFGTDRHGAQQSGNRLIRGVSLDG